MSETIECPHCSGSGRVAEDFLTDDHVHEVFADFCKVFDFHLAYGVESYDDSGEKVRVVQDTSARSCHNSHEHYLPRSYFTRDRERRLSLMRSDYEKQQRAEAAKERREKRGELAEIERRAAALRQELGA